MVLSLLKKIQDRAQNLEPVMKTFGIFGMFNYPLFYLFWEYLEKENENILLRSIAFGLCIPLALINYWPQKLMRFKAIYWYLAILYCLPFFVTYMFIENHGSNGWVTNATIALLWFTLITDLISFIILLSTGILLGSIAHYLVVGPSNFAGSDVLGAFINYAWSILIAALFSYSREKVIQEKLLSMKMLAGSIAHELRTPLSAMNMGAQSLGEFLPVYQQAYEKAKEAKLQISTLNHHQERSLAELPEDLQRVASNAHTMINILLMNLKENLTYPLTAYSMNHCIEEALKAYPFSPPERARVHWQKGDDFLFKGHLELIKHVLFNLLKNALYVTTFKGEIFLSLERGEKTNYLIFKDTGKGIAAKDLAHIFDRFYSRTEHGTGIGLAFCRSVCRELGGDITCDSVEGAYTLFTISLPVIVGE